jgi:4-diphosphocytidyl-2-C-methyl-D-erythritol kinase
MRILTPAKINLTLEILGRRPDGYHELATWMIPIALYDTLSIEPASENSFVSNNAKLAGDDSNLILRAVAAFRRATGTQENYRIVLEKNIPIGAGLGGGSSNAAATLRLLNHLTANPLSPRMLLGMAAELGSDVAFFVESRSAWCTGRGEQMKPRSFPNDRSICLVKPGFSVSTPGAYAAYAKLPESRKRGEQTESIWGPLRNDLEPAVFPKYLLLPEIKRWFRAQPETEITLMSGSGSTMFAVTGSTESAAAVLGRFRAEFGESFWMFAGQLNPSSLEVAADAKTA